MRTQGSEPYYYPPGKSSEHDCATKGHVSKPKVRLLQKKCPAATTIGKKPDLYVPHASQTFCRPTKVLICKDLKMFHLERPPLVKAGGM
jgi:hypothetical protein